MNLIKKFYEMNNLKGLGELIEDSEISAHITDCNGQSLNFLNLMERIFITSNGEKLGIYEYRNNCFIVVND